MESRDVCFGSGVLDSPKRELAIVGHANGLPFVNPAQASMSTEDALTLELPRLRRNHARCRTAFRGATPASLTTATKPVRSLNLYPHPRPSPVLRHARRFLVSSVPRRSVGYIFSPRRMLLCNPSSLHHDLKAADHAQISDLVKLLHPISPIQST
jgi:hypothetical protein